MDRGLQGQPPRPCVPIYPMYAAAAFCSAKVQRRAAAHTDIHTERKTERAVCAAAVHTRTPCLYRRNSGGPLQRRSLRRRESREKKERERERVCRPRHTYTPTHASHTHYMRIHDESHPRWPQAASSASTCEAALHAQVTGPVIFTHWHAAATAATAAVAAARGIYLSIQLRDRSRPSDLKDVIINVQDFYQVWYFKCSAIRVSLLRNFQQFSRHEASGNSPRVSPGMGSTPPRDGSHEPEQEDSGDNFTGLCSSLYWKQTKEDFEEAWDKDDTQVLFCFL
ncbi:unnamed protein product [Trichogramma brassicae]|uniref:Uncharacterized protein n=1 Tax=Trichogramma brassicae TaxID=86971 RepID=A0A6H5J821_9HYME|nr:unnamed protein product [Trichogramma brassicae]